MMTSLSFSLFFFWWLAAPTSPEIVAKDKYLLARRAYLNQNWQEAQKLFEETLSLLSQVTGKTERQRQLFSIGRSDVRFHLAQIADRTNDTFGACRQYAEIRKKVDQLPAGWENWPINTKLPERFAISSRRLRECRLVPSEISWTVTPPQATVEVLGDAAFPKSPTSPPPPRVDSPKAPEKTDVPAAPAASAPKWRVVKSPAKLLAGKFSFRVRAEGFLPLEQEVEIPSWENKKLTFALKPKPRERKIAIIRRPVKPTPPKAVPTWVWITVAAGAVVVGGAVAVGIYAATRPIDRVSVSFR
ncbi:MAG: hypothetical protein H6728_11390 [Myxococcales bacterium]|nr:hypothetical protein [Myxococcales bacterium]